MNLCWLQYNQEPFSSVLFDLHSTTEVSQEDVLVNPLCSLWLRGLTWADAEAQQTTATTVPLQHCKYTVALDEHYMYKD